MDKKEKVPFYAGVAKKTSKKPVSAEKEKHIEAKAAGNSKKTFPAKNGKQTENFSDRTFSYKITSNIFEPLSKEANQLIKDFDEIIQSESPLNSKQLCALPYKIRDLSHELTDTRGKRRLGYMNSKESIAAYVRYFSWWNLYRLCSVLESLPAGAFDFLGDGDAVLDIGSGPLTAVIALWLSRPELRQKKLNIIVTDLSHNALLLGEELYMAVAARTCADGGEPWHITRIKGTFGVEIRQKASFVICANMVNELVQDSERTPDEDAKNIQRKLFSYADEKAAFFLVEPGVPRGSRFISLFRDGFIRKGFNICSPCPQCAACAFPGTRNAKWCHFVRGTDEAPAALAKRSEAAGLPKDRAAVSFVFAENISGAPKAAGALSGASDGKPQKTLAVRVVSDEIALPGGRKGRYACSRWGAVLLTGRQLKDIKSGSLVTIKIDDSKKPLLQKDKKTGFLTIEIG
ncbi:MAG: hypothetical protein J5798_00835 [Spirochaetaceae bacterium]|nr:hypothetical protein [Spirochaetaceae bacterium]